MKRTTGRVVYAIQNVDRVDRVVDRVVLKTFYLLNAPHHCVEHSRGRTLTTSATYTYIYLYIHIYVYIFIYVYIYIWVCFYIYGAEDEFQIYPHRCLSGIENVLEKF